MVVGDAVRVAVVVVGGGGGGGGGGGPWVDDEPPAQDVTATASKHRPKSPTATCESLPTKSFPRNTARLEDLSKSRVASEFSLSSGNQNLCLRQLCLNRVIGAPSLAHAVLPLYFFLWWNQCRFPARQ